jgi:ribonuclease HI
MPILLYCDGLTEPVNPGGIACYGWVAYRGGERLGKGSAVVCSGPGATNNVAEYSAVIAGLEWLLSRGLAGEEVVVRSDSQLCIYQLSGRYAVRSERLWPLFRRARGLASRFKKVRFEWVPRERNAEADGLSREAYAAAAFPEGREKREERARALVPLVEHLGGPFYAVPSQSEPGRVYEVDLQARRCNCPDFAARWKSGLKCKHLLAAEMAAAGDGGVVAR